MENVAAALQVSSEAGRELADALCNGSEASGTHCWAPTPCTDTLLPWPYSCMRLRKRKRLKLPVLPQQNILKETNDS